MQIFGKLAAGAALVTLAFAQPALAGTRAADSLPTLVNAERIASPVKSKKSEGIGTAIAPGIIIVGFAVVAGFLFLILDGDGEDLSPGT